MREANSFFAENLDECVEIVGRFPNRQSAALPILKLIQKTLGRVPNEIIPSVADFLEIPPARLATLVGFYTMLCERPRGKHVIAVCTNVSCMLAGAEELLEEVEGYLKIKEGWSTPDMKIFLEKAECLGACDKAPFVMVDDKSYPCVTRESLFKLLDELRC